MARKREAARTRALCITCCKRRSERGKASCSQCRVSRERRRRKRQGTSSAVYSEHAVAAYEHAGDIAREHNAHEGAAQIYKRAFQAATASSDKVRIAEKLSRTLYLESNPSSAIDWLEIALSYQAPDDGDHGRKLAELLIERAEQRWAENRFKDALPDLERAIGIAQAAGDWQIYKRANLRIVVFLRNLGRYDEASSFLKNIGDVEESDDPVFRSMFFEHRGVAFKREGMAEQAYDSFKRALNEARDTENPSRVTKIWLNYSACALDLGNIALAKENLEQALLIARRYRSSWLIAMYCLYYADMLWRTGHVSVAKHYLNEGLSYDGPAKIIKLYQTEVGIRLALAFGDSEILQKCAIPGVLEATFESEIPSDIVHVAASFAQFYASNNQLLRAQEILHRAISSMTSTSLIETLPLQIARYGFAEDIAPARSLLVERSHFPHSAVACASLSLFDAFLAKRNDQVKRARRCALEAIDRFEKLGWIAYADMARSVLGLPIAKQPSDERVYVPLAEMRSSLTARELQVAELVLKGLSNRAIAEALAIKETTIESHVSSILSRLGVRSRYQLRERLPLLTV